VVEYCITVQNNGSADATSVVLTDVLTTQPVTYQAGSIFTEDGTTCSGGAAEDDDAAGVDESPNGGSESSGTVSGTFTTVPAGAGKALRFPRDDRLRRESHCEAAGVLVSGTPAARNAMRPCAASAVCRSDGARSRRRAGRSREWRCSRCSWPLRPRTRPRSPTPRTSRT
jgi:uncharacterized repeat protein (TIGR01451 family)